MGGTEPGNGLSLEEGLVVLGSNVYNIRLGACDVTSGSKGCKQHGYVGMGMGLALERPWLALCGPFLSSCTQLGLENSPLTL